MVQDPDDAELLHADYEVGGVLKVLEERGVRVTKLCRRDATRTNTIQVRSLLLLLLGGRSLIAWTLLWAFF